MFFILIYVYHLSVYNLYIYIYLYVSLKCITFSEGCYPMVYDFYLRCQVLNVSDPNFRAFYHTYTIQSRVILIYMYGNTHNYILYLSYL